MIEKGMGRARLTRFAAITVPAVVACAGFGFAIVQGAVSADLASSQGFTVHSSGATADSLQLGLEDATSATDDSTVTTKDKAAAEAAITGLNANDLCLAANTDLGTFGTVGLNVKSSDPVNLGSVDLNATDIEANSATLPSTKIGEATNDLTGLKTSNVEAPGGFGLASTGTAGSVQLDTLDATAYELTLSSGLTLKGLSIAPTAGTATC